VRPGVRDQASLRILVKMTPILQGVCLVKDPSPHKSKEKFKPKHAQIEGEITPVEKPYIAGEVRRKQNHALIEGETWAWNKGVREKN